MLYLARMIEDQSTQGLRDIDPALHMQKGHEEQAYEFINQFYRDHRSLPSIEVIANDTGVVLPTAPMPLTYYFERVKGRALYSHLTKPLGDLNEFAENPQQNIDKIQETIDAIYTIRTRFNTAGGGVELSDSLAERVMQQSIARRTTSGSLLGVTTGYDPLDEAMDGYQNGDLVVWVARPGRAKSWLLLKQCYSAWAAGHKPLYISNEMGGEQNMRRLIGIHSGINPNFIKRGRIQTGALPYFNRAIEELMRLRPFPMVTANFSRTVDQIASFVEQHNPDIVFIDAGYLLSPKKKRFGSGGRRETISDVVEELKELAANINRPIVITVQFNRSAEHRRRGSSGGGNPISHLSLAEIGETDVIGQAATHVIGLEFPPAPLERDAYRVFGFLKGREGESGWWLTNFMPTPYSTVDLSIVPFNDRAYELIREAQAQAESGGRRRGYRSLEEIPPEERTSLMRINQ
jgi:replicative DNA helicase